MKINATAAELQSIAEVLKLAAIIDDRAPRADKARIAAWAEQVHRHNLTEGDLLDGVQDFYDSPSERAIQVGDLIHHARNAKRRRLTRDDDTRHAEIAAAGDRKTADEVAGVVAGMTMGRPVKRTEWVKKAEASLQCCSTGAEARAAIKDYLQARKAAGPAPRKRKPVPAAAKTEGAVQ